MELTEVYIKHIKELEEQESKLALKIQELKSEMYNIQRIKEMYAANLNILQSGDLKDYVFKTKDVLASRTHIKKGHDVTWEQYTLSIMKDMGHKWLLTKDLKEYVGQAEQVKEHKKLETFRKSITNALSRLYNENKIERKPKQDSTSNRTTFEYRFLK